MLSKNSNSIDRERELVGPPPLMSELKNTVIVKNDGKNLQNPHHMDSKVSHSPKLRTADMMAHYMPQQAQHKPAMYEYRSPSQSPHGEKMQHASHHRSQLPSPHSMQRQSPHSQPHPSPPERYSRTDQMMYTPKVTSAYSPYPMQPSMMTAGTHYMLPSGVSVSSSSPKPKAPHIYGKPTAGIVSGIPVSRPQEMMNKVPPLPASVSPSPYQQQYHPAQHTPPMSVSQYQPPPAHSSRSNSTMVADRAMYDRIYPSPGLSVKPVPPHHGTSPPSAAAAPPNMSRSPHLLMQPMSSMQTQPLDLGVSSDRNGREGSPKRKTSSIPMGSPIALDVKKRRVESPNPMPTSQPQLSRVSEPSPLIASAATTITTVVNTVAYCSPAATMVVSQPQPAGLEVSLGSPMVSITTIPTRPSSVEVVRPSSTGSNTSSPNVPPVINNSPAPSPIPVPPSTPVKSLTPSIIDSEKSNSPGPTKSTAYPVRHLKKAWLQRHTGEDIEDTTGVTGTGSCVTLPMAITPTPPKEVTPPTTSLHNIGSMAVNSINKSSKKPNRKPASSVNGHNSDSIKADESSSSDQERVKSPPKRKPPKVKRKKGGTARKVPTDDKNKPAVSESDSDKDTGSDSLSVKDSDSGASTNQTSGKKSANGGGHAKSGANDKEPRKRGRRPKSSKNDKGEEPRNKKPREDPPPPPRDPYRKPPVGQLKKTGEHFLQDGPCFEVAPKLSKCRECRWTPNQRSKTFPNIFCRFYAFRRLRYTAKGQLAIAGFSDPYKDATEVSFF